MGTTYLANVSLDANGSGTHYDATAEVDTGITAGSPPTVPTSSFTATASVSLSTNQTAVVQPGSGATGTGGVGRVSLQLVGVRLLFNGNRVAGGQLLPSVNVSRSMDRHIQVATFSLVALDGVSPLGNPMSGVYGGLEPITINLEYRALDGTVFTEPLLTNGIVQVMDRQLSPGVVDSVSVADRGQVFATNPVTYKLPPGAGLSRDAFITRLAQLAGETNISIPAPPSASWGVIQKSVDLVDGDWLAEAQGKAEVDGGSILWDRHGDLTVTYDTPELGPEPARWVFTPADIIMRVDGQPVELSVRPPVTAWTKVDLKGNQQVLRGSGCGTDTVNLQSELQTVYANNSLPFQQPATLAVNATPYLTVSPTLQKTAEIFTAVTRECETVVATATDVHRFYNPVTPRYTRSELSADRPVLTYFSCWLEGNSSTDIARAYSHPRFMRVERVEETRQFDAQGELVGEIIERYGFHTQKVAHKQRADASVAWDTVNGTAATGDDKDRGDGMFIVGVETFKLVERQTITYANEDGYVKSRRVVVEGFGRKRGELYLYGDGEWGETIESFQTLRTEEETWEVIGESLVRVTRLLTDIDPLKNEADPGSTQIGSPPATERRSDAPINPADFTDPADAAAAQAASRFEQQEMTASCVITGLDQVRPRNVIPGQYMENAETPTELGRLCRRIGLRGISPGIVFHTPIHGRVAEGDSIHVTGPEGSGIAHDMKVKEVQHVIEGQGPKMTRIAATAYADPNTISVTTTN